MIIHYTIVCYTILYYIKLYYTILYYTILYYTILYYTQVLGKTINCIRWQGPTWGAMELPLNCHYSQVTPGQGVAPVSLPSSGSWAWVDRTQQLCKAICLGEGNSKKKPGPRCPKADDYLMMTMAFSVERNWGPYHVLTPRPSQHKYTIKKKPQQREQR